MKLRLRSREPGPREELDVPRSSRNRALVRYDQEGFSRFAESIAGFLGTSRYLAIQTVVVVAWILLNVVGLIHHWDPYPFILLNLGFSTQAAYAAPLILLAQNRQEDRDRANVERDRDMAARTQDDAIFMIKQLSAIRLALADAVTIEDLNRAIDSLERQITQAAAD
jgi:uncharacterized membrane protein